MTENILGSVPTTGTHQKAIAKLMFAIKEKFEPFNRE